MQPPNNQNLRPALGQFATGVTILSCANHNQNHGMTANSFCSISLAPPLVQVAVNQQAGFNQWLKKTQFYGINILAENQQELAMHFAGKPKTTITPPWLNQSFEQESELHSVPLLSGCLAWLVCSVEKISSVSTHDVYLSQVLQVKHTTQKPLLFFNGQYTTINS